jgi:tetratricopeptide (TPR) repeat protein
VETNASELPYDSSELLQAILKLQDQVTAQQKVLDENAREAREFAARNAEAFTTGLQKIERAFSEQQQSFFAQSTLEVQAAQSANRTVIIVVAAFAVMGFLAMLITACFQWRMSKAWSRISTTLPMAWLGRHSPISNLTAGDYSSVSSARVEDSSLRLLAAIERIEKRIQGLEQGPKPTLKFQESAQPQAHSINSVQVPRTGKTDAGARKDASSNDARISILLSEGQSKWRENDWEGALGFFNEVLSLNPNQGEALVRKGATLERLKKLNEAFECYDRAIAVDDSMTIAYLHKGGLCNRQERFKEALECYEKALRTQEGWGG